MRFPHHVGRSPEPPPCGYDISGLATVFASLRRATRSDAAERVGVGNPTPLADSCCSLDTARPGGDMVIGGHSVLPAREP